MAYKPDVIGERKQTERVISIRSVNTPRHHCLIDPPRRVGSLSSFRERHLGVFLLQVPSLTAHLRSISKSMRVKSRDSADRTVTELLLICHALLEFGSPLEGSSRATPLILHSYVVRRVYKILGSIVENRFHKVNHTFRSRTFWSNLDASDW